MSRNICRAAAILLLCVGMSLKAMVYDNRFFPFIRTPYITVPSCFSHTRAGLFITTANRAFGNADTEIGIPELFGVYDQAQVAKSMQIAGYTNPVLQYDPELANANLVWAVRGKIQAQGLMFSMRKTLGEEWLTVGFSWGCMRSYANEFFTSNFGQTIRTTGATVECLDAIRRQMNQDTGIQSIHAHQIGLTDLELYLRYGGRWNYQLKCRQIDAGISFGGYIPTGVMPEPNLPASVPFGGGSYGAYVRTDLELEVKEDCKVGLVLQAIKRVARTCVRRMPVCNEPQPYGVVVGRARVNPGATGVFSPYISVENLRDGFGARVQYTLTVHGTDRWYDRRADKAVPVNFPAIERYSRWQSSYVTLNAFYDFGKMKKIREFDPIFMVEWDIPVSFFDAHGVAKTQKVTVGFEFSF